MNPFDLDKSGFLEPEEVDVQKLYLKAQQILDDRLESHLAQDDPYWIAKREYETAANKLSKVN